MIILSIDSGIERCGYAVFDSSTTEPTLISFGLLSTHKSQSTSQRLFKLETDFADILLEHKPDIVVMEALFFNINKKTMVMVAQSQGALMSSCGRTDISVEFLTPSAIKQMVTGYGKADKKMVEKMIMMLLKLKVAPKPDDVVDAIACGYAYCCLHKFDSL